MARHYGLETSLICWSGIRVGVRSKEGCCSRSRLFLVDEFFTWRWSVYRGSAPSHLDLIENCTEPGSNKEGLKSGLGVVLLHSIDDA